MDREYLYDTAFLKELDKNRNKFYYVKVIVLDMNERPISEIEGRVQDGASISIDGHSAVRRTCSLTFVALEKENDLTNVENLLSINKKVKIEIGIVNNFHNSYDNDIFWFPQGTFVIIDPSISNNSTGCVISLSCKDKMALLNGEAGGNLPASITFHEYDQVIGTQEVSTWPKEPNNYTVYDFGHEVNGSQYWRWSKTEGFYESSKSDIGEIESTPNLVYDIIQTLVCNYGGEGLDKIIINDVPLEIKQSVRNTSGSSIYFNTSTSEYSMNQSYGTDTSGNWIEFQSGEDCGYVYTDFTYPGELISGIGENVCSVLDKIKNTLGNFEYFYDIDGNFVFQEIKNYLNVSYLPVSNGKITTPLDYTSNKFKHYLDAIETLNSDEARRNLIIETINNQNLFNTTENKNSNYSITYPSTEHFTKKMLISYIPESHSWEEINNLYLINQNNYLVDYNGNKKSIYEFNSEDGLIESFSNSPSYTNIKNDFHIWGKGDGSNVIHYHLAIKSKPTIMNTYRVDLISNKIKIQNDTKNDEEDDEEEENYKTEYQLKVDNEKGQYYYQPDDWRVEVYLQGKLKEYLHERPDVYEQEMLDLLPLIYVFELENGKIVGHYIEDVMKSNNLNYFVDYLEPVDNLYDCSVDLIGSRIYSYQQDKIIKLFNNDIPNVIIININGDPIYNTQLIERCEREGQPRSNVDGVLYSNLAFNTLGYSAQEVARDLLYQYTDYNSAISFSCVPIFYLEPNTRITVKDKKSGIFGDYIINNITRPLSGQGMMSISATKALERI